MELKAKKNCFERLLKVFCNFKDQQKLPAVLPDNVCWLKLMCGISWFNVQFILQKKQMIEKLSKA